MQDDGERVALMLDVIERNAPWDILALPPLPSPSKTMSGQARTGVLLSLMALSFILLPLHLSEPGTYPPPITTSANWTMLLWGEAVAILGCIAGLMFGDPGTIKRSTENCFPVPAAVADRLRNGKTLDGMANLSEEGRVYCTRCLGEVTRLRTAAPKDAPLGCTVLTPPRFCVYAVFQDGIHDSHAASTPIPCVPRLRDLLALAQAHVGDMPL